MVELVVSFLNNGIIYGCFTNNLVFATLYVSYMRLKFF